MAAHKHSRDDGGAIGARTEAATAQTTANVISTAGDASRKVFVRAPSQVSRLRLAETWPKPVKWCSTRNTLWKPRASATRAATVPLPPQS